MNAIGCALLIVGSMAADLIGLHYTGGLLGGIAMTILARGLYVDWRKWQSERRPKPLI